MAGPVNGNGQWNPQWHYTQPTTPAPSTPAPTHAPGAGWGTQDSYTPSDHRWGQGQGHDHGNGDNGQHNWGTEHLANYYTDGSHGTTPPPGTPGPNGNGPTTYGPTTYGPTTYGPTTYGPTTYGPNTPSPYTNGSGGTTGGGGTNGGGGITGAGSASGLGVQVDYQNGDTIAAYEQRTGVKPTSVGNFIGMSNGSVDMSSAEKTLDDAAANGVGTVQLSVRSGESGALSSQEVSQYQQLAQEAKAKGITLQVRFGYEMNNQGVSGFSNPATFQQQWSQVADAVHSAGGQMIWCVAQGDPSSYQQWIPKDPSTVDGVGVDVYHFGSNSIDPNEVKAALQGVANLPGLQGKPLSIPETGVALSGDGSDAAKATQWLDLLSDPSLKAEFPSYTGFDWFDYNKPGDIDSSLSDNPAYAAALKAWASGQSS